MKFLVNNFLFKLGKSEIYQEFQQEDVKKLDKFKGFLQYDMCSAYYTFFGYKTIFKVFRKLNIIY